MAPKQQTPSYEDYQIATNVNIPPFHHNRCIVNMYPWFVLFLSLLTLPLRMYSEYVSMVRPLSLSTNITSQVYSEYGYFSGEKCYERREGTSYRVFCIYIITLHPWFFLFLSLPSPHFFSLIFHLSLSRSFGMVLSVCP